MPVFRDLSDFFETQPKQLPINGKTYDFPGTISAKTGLVLQAVSTEAVRVQKAVVDGEAAELNGDVITDLEDDLLRREILGDALDELLADGVTVTQLEHIFRTLLIWHQYGEGAAVLAWEMTDGPKAEPKKPRDRQRRRVGSVSASTTKRPASTRSTGESEPANPLPGLESSNTGDSSKPTSSTEE